MIRVKKSWITTATGAAGAATTTTLTTTSKRIPFNKRFFSGHRRTPFSTLQQQQQQYRYWNWNSTTASATLNYRNYHSSDHELSSSLSLSLSEPTPFSSFQKRKFSEWNFKRFSSVSTAADSSSSSSFSSSSNNNRKLELNFGKVACLAESSVLGSVGQTVAMVTLSSSSTTSTTPSTSLLKNKNDNNNNNNNDDTSTTTTTTSFMMNGYRLAECLQTICRESSSSSNMIPLTLEYHQRHYAVGKIPTTNASRTDNRRPTNYEILAARAIDRSLRPLLMKKNDGSSSSSPAAAAAAAIHLNCSIQACPINNNNNNNNTDNATLGGYPLTTALNSASAVLKHRLKQPVASVYLCLLENPQNNNNNNNNRNKKYKDTTSTSTMPTPIIVIDPPKKPENTVCELLYTGTRDHIVMMEFSGMLPESQLQQLIEFAHECIQPTLDIIIESNNNNNDDDGNDEKNKTFTKYNRMDIDEDQIRSDLGLVVLDTSNSNDSPDNDSNNENSQQQQEQQQEHSNDYTVIATKIYDLAMNYCKQKLWNASLKTFGVSDPLLIQQQQQQSSDGTEILPTIHSPSSSSSSFRDFQRTSSLLVPKVIRGKREQILQKEIVRILKNGEFFNSNNGGNDDGGDDDDHSMIINHYKAMIDADPSIVSNLADSIHSKLLSSAMKEAAIKYKCRADGRGSGNNNFGDGVSSSSSANASASVNASANDGCLTIRPLHMQVPALPDVVHGSAIFSRGETQVLCTVTVGPPKDGILLNDPYNPPPSRTTIKGDGDNSGNNDNNGGGVLPSQGLPVGSLRYLRTQEYLLSDLNSRKIRADREQTGDSGEMRERRRAFLQYDFPPYSKGEVGTGGGGAGGGGGGSPNRREIGHGALAEKAILPILPQPRDFPYVIRMTSEVTSSNGSSSMASVCGATLALLDAGVPIVAPVAGVSVGLVWDDDNDDNENNNDKEKYDDNFNNYQLLLDITGTEDHFGVMDFKIAGTENEVTAIQLDVKRPLPLSIISKALQLAKLGRIEILKEMDVQTSVSSQGAVSNLNPRSELKDSAPRVEVVRFDPTRKKDLLGPGGVVIRQMEDRFNVSLDLTQEGQCLLYGDDKEMVRAAKAAVMDLVSDVEVGGIYEGTVIELRDFGAIIELLRNKEGLCHVSELANREELRSHPRGGAIGLINSMLRVGQRIQVVCTAVDPVQGTIRVKPVSLEELKTPQK